MPPVMLNSFDFQAIVISSCSAEHQEVEKDLVLLLKSQRQRIGLKNYIYSVSKQAFIPPIIEKCFDNIELAKNIERRFSMPLKFGDIIQFNENDVDHATGMIHCFHRERPIYEVSSNNNGQLLRLGGIIEPSKPTTFWTPMESMTIPTEEAKRAEPNVWLYAWVKVETTMRTAQDPFNLELTFDSFAGFDPSEQGRVCEAPWHRNSLESKYSVWASEPRPCEDDDLIDCEPREGVFEEENKWAETIKKQLGLYVGERLFVCKDLPQYDFVMPLLKPISSFNAHSSKQMIYPTNGEYYHFSAIWSTHHSAFLVTEILPFPLIRGHAATQSGALLVRVVSAGIRGLFKDHDETLGLIDDPDHELAMFEFHPACYDNLTAMVEVRAIRASENRTVRYRILKALRDDDNMTRYEKWLHDNELTVGPVTGVVINNDTVMCARYPNVFFRLPITQRYPVGSGVTIYGKRMKDVYNEIMVIEAKLEPDFSIKNLWIMAKPFPAWVRESPQIRDCRRGCATMEVFSLARATPIIPLSNTSVLASSRRQSAKSSPHGSSHGSSRSSVYSIVNNRFTGVGLSKLALHDQQQNAQSDRRGSDTAHSGSEHNSSRHGSNRGSNKSDDQQPGRRDGSDRGSARGSDRQSNFQPERQGSDHHSDRYGSDRGSAQGSEKHSNFQPERQGSDHQSDRGSARGSERQSNFQPERQDSDHHSDRYGSDRGSARGSDRQSSFQPERRGSDHQSDRGSTRGSERQLDHQGSDHHSDRYGSDRGARGSEKHSTFQPERQGSDRQSDRGSARGSDRQSNFQEERQGSDYHSDRGSARGSEKHSNFQPERQGSDHHSDRYGSDRGARGSEKHSTFQPERQGSDHQSDRGSARGSGRQTNFQPERQGSDYHSDQYGSDRGSERQSNFQPERQGSDHYSDRYESERGSAYQSESGRGYDHPPNPELNRDGSYHGSDRGSARGSDVQSHHTLERDYSERSYSEHSGSYYPDSQEGYDRGSESGSHRHANQFYLERSESDRSLNRTPQEWDDGCVRQYGSDRGYYYGSRH
uniref:AAA domain-containing protein n=1 Tax=Caenorhabditis tropicalis TaxID=1561998 RepID=A0A1I7UJF0_9PELO